MHWLYALLRYFPFVAVPSAVCFGEVGRYFRRRRKRAQYFYWAVAALLLLSTVLWFFFRGDINSDKWIPKHLPQVH